MSILARVSLRPVTADDVEALYAIHRRALGAYVEATWGSWDESWQREHFRMGCLRGNREVILLDRAAIGFLDVVRQPEGLFLANIEIDPEHQGRGLGSALIGCVLGRGERSGLPVNLQVLKTNPRARELYLRLGFTDSGETETHQLMVYRPPQSEGAPVADSCQCQRPGDL